MKLLFKITLFSIALSFVSCVKDVDFDQASQIELTPIYKMSLVNFSFDQASLIEGVPNVGITFTDEAAFTGFENLENKEYLERADIELEINNPFDREFVLNFNFLDKEGSVTYTYKTLNIPAGNIFSDKESIVIASHPDIVNSVQATVTFEMLPSAGGSTIDQSIFKEMTFKLGGDFHFRIR